MRLHFHTVVPSAVSLIGLVSMLSAPASAGEIDPASAVRGSLGVSLDELMFGGAGTSVFLLNAGCLLLFAAIAVGARLLSTRETRRIAFRPISHFAR